jgi:hypothetical protein
LQQLNPVLRVLSQRPDPVIIETVPNTNGIPENSNERKRKVDQAGGYDYSVYTKRNWMEIAREIKKLTANAS